MNLFFKNKFKKYLIISLFFLLFVPIPALALWEALAYSLPLSILSFFILITKSLAWVAGALLDWVTSGNFIDWGYTNNLVVNLGLGITKQFVNLGLVTVLIVVSLLITLNIKSYDGKKILVRLIAVALLVNFAPIFIGLIIDATNIIMNYFLVGINKGVSGILNNFTGNSDSIIAGLEDINNWSAGLALLTRAVICIILNISIAFAFALLAAVFVFRYIAVWFLTILSPLAFVAWILPATKKFWDMWWQQLVQWSIIGIPMAFFLYLAMASYSAIGTAFRSNLNMPGLDSSTAQWFDTIFPYILVLVMIYAGFAIGLATSAKGADWAQKSSQWLGNKGWRKAVGWTGKKTLQGINAPDRKLWTNKEGKTITARTLARGLTSKWDAAPVARWFRPEPLKKFGEQENIIQALKKDITGDSGDEMNKLANGKYHGARAAAALHAIMKDRGDSQDVVKAYLEKYKKINKNENMTEEDLFKDEKFLNDQTLVRALEYLDQAGMKGKALRNDPRLAKIGVKLTGKEINKINKDFKDPAQSSKERTKLLADKRKTELVKRLIDAKPGDITNWEREVVDNTEIMEALMALKGEVTLRNIANLKGEVTARQFTIDKAFSEWIEKKYMDKDKKWKAGQGPNNRDKYWQEYMKYLKDTYNVSEVGIEKAIQNPRVQSMGYNKEGGRYINSKQRQMPPGTKESPGDALGIEIADLKNIQEANKPILGRQSGGGKPPQGRQSGGGKPPQGRSSNS